MQITKMTIESGQVSRDEIIRAASVFADIVICCTPIADTELLQSWSGVNDTLKDNSLLLLSKADVLQKQGTLQSTLHDLENLASDLFMSICPIAVPQALMAVAADGSKNLPLWKGSGGEHFVTAIAKLVRLGQQGDVDQAEAFLKRYPPPSGLDQPIASEPEPNADADIYLDALELLQIRAGEMLAAIRSEPETDIIGECLRTAADLADILTGANSHSTGVEELRADAEEATDMMVLFQLEKTKQASSDAVTLLLQLKQEIHLQAAA
jgi:hypothetical protein